MTGEDFTFGRARGGNVGVLAEVGATCGLATRAVGPVTLEGEVVSSSRIRDALVAGDPQTATRLLTRPFAIRGPVQHGDKVGRTINFPTANLDIGSYLRPRYGIYAVTLPDGRARILPDGRTSRTVLQGAANIGIRPTKFDPPKDCCSSRISSISAAISMGRTIEVAFHAPSCAARRNSMTRCRAHRPSARCRVQIRPTTAPGGIIGICLPLGRAQPMANRKPLIDCDIHGKRAAPFGPRRLGAGMAGSSRRVRIGSLTVRVERSRDTICRARCLDFRHERTGGQALCPREPEIALTGAQG